MNDATTGWTGLREFAEVDLLQSFVLAWEIKADALLIDLDLVLLPGHSFHEEPRPAEGACYRPAVIEYPNCTQVSGQEKGDTGNIAAAAGLLKPGRVAGLRRIEDGHYEITGDFGTVDIEAERPLLRLEAR
jgi:hypothetical protein